MNEKFFPQESSIKQWVEEAYALTVSFLYSFILRQNTPAVIFAPQYYYNVTVDTFFWPKKKL